MSDKITWWPAALAKGITKPTMVLMRYDWPDERVYALGIYNPFKMVGCWTDASMEMALQTPDYFVYAEKIEKYISIPEEAQYTYNPEKGGTP